MSEPLGIIISAMIAALVGLAGAYVGWRRLMVDERGSNLADAIRLKNEYKEEYRQMKAEIKEIKLRAETLEKKVAGLEEAAEGILKGACMLHGQVVSLGKLPVYTPPEGLELYDEG